MRGCGPTRPGVVGVCAPEGRSALVGAVWFETGAGSRLPAPGGSRQRWRGTLPKSRRRRWAPPVDPDWLGTMTIQSGDVIAPRSRPGLVRPGLGCIPLSLSARARRGGSRWGPGSVVGGSGFLGSRVMSGGVCGGLLGVNISVSVGARCEIRVGGWGDALGFRIRIK